jgi:hypothetical protein
MGHVSRLGSSTRTKLSEKFDKEGRIDKKGKFYIENKSPVLVLRYPDTMNICFGNITEDNVFKFYQFFTSNNHTYLSLYFSLINQVTTDGVREPHEDINDFNILSPLLIFCFYTIDNPIQDSIKFNQKWGEYKDLKKIPEEEIRNLNYNRWGKDHLKVFFKQSGGKRRTKRNSKKAKKTRTRKHKRSQKKLRSRRR